ncbi:MAG: N-acetylmuramoyl-L-alanine amidase [candidate division KSB1 bacterium]|nr:N-acetylmuramoyl-L-alanine amidase [candidate division KSB1 bacterium]
MMNKQGPTILSTFLILMLSCAGSAPIYVMPGAVPEPAANGAHAPAPQQDIRPRFSNGKIVVDVYPRHGEGYIDVALRISHEPKAWRKLKRWNGNRRFPQRGRPIPVPYDYLNARYRMQAVRKLFPKDRMTGDGWKHVVTYRGETTWFIAELFTGDGANYPIVQKANSMRKGQPIAIGQVIIIPNRILSEEFTRTLPSHPDLTFEKGRDGKLYAVYRLKEGEALYSAVVVRFTGRVDADDVNDMARKILRLNGLKDPRRIPTGFKIRIPFEYLSDDFLTEGAPSRMVKVDLPRRGSRKYVILDPGHGGSDPGTREGGLYEDELAYDIMLRIKRILQARGVTVYTTIHDSHDNNQPKNSRKLANGTREYVNTTPRYLISDPRVSVNLRVYLVHSIYRKLKRMGVKDRDIYFVSLHLDHRHPSLRGAMIYYPYRKMRKPQFRPPGRIYKKYKESRNVTLHFDSSEIKRSEAYSYRFSLDLKRSLKSKRIPVQKERPIRPFVILRNRKYIPAVIRYSKVPTSVLIEVVNMANRHDRANISDYRFRQRVAEAIAAAIL